MKDFVFNSDFESLFKILILTALVGCEPKPQHLERTRVVGLEPPPTHHYKSHRSRHHDHNHGAPKEKASKDNASSETFKLWDDGPNFDTNLRQNVVALIGRTAYLTCRVFDRGNKTVR